jgi:hypothetical protein
MNYTLTYSQDVDGWVSFYSYYPDWMIGMNNYFYTFKGGNLYRHNVNPLRNTFYSDWWIQIGNPGGAFTPASIQSVMNDAPLENKLFKTIVLQGDSIWDVQLHTDIQDSGYIQAAWFDKKEQAYFAFVRNNSNGQLALRSLNGIGKSISVTGATDEVNFSISPLVSVGDILSIGDYFYFSLPPYTTPQLAGEVTNIIINYPGGINRVVINTAIPGAVPIPIQDAFFFYIKNSVAESHGVLGHYCVFDIQNTSTSKIELFTVGSEVMKSFP